MTPAYCKTPPDPRAPRVLNALRRLDELYQNNQELLFENGLYKRFRDFLQGLFSNKCAYCEVKLVALQKPVIDHYRPKGKVTDVGDRVVQDDSGPPPPKPHPGYFWLAYEWGNLLPSCWVCNSTHKKNRFPVQGSHAFHPTALDAESPLLYNPLNPPSPPEHHFGIDLNSGVLEGLDDVGRTTILALSLNRAELVDERREAIEDTANLINALLPAVALDRPDRAVHEARAQAIRDGKAQYNFARKALYDSAMQKVAKKII